MYQACIQDANPRQRCYYDGHLINDVFCAECIASTLEIYAESRFSDRINEFIRDISEYIFYHELELVESEVNGRACLLREELSPDAIDPKSGLTNRELAQKGRVPVDPKSGYSRIHLHHIGQKPDSPFAELSRDEDVSYHGSPLHFAESTMIDRRHFAKERRAHWKARW